MMKRNFFFIFGFLLLSSMTIPIQADPLPNNTVVTTTPTVEHVVWNKTPITFIVPTGQERMISFPEAVTLSNTDPKLTTDKVSILADAGTLYIRAKQAFDPIRVEVKLINSGQIVLLDLSSKASADDTPVEVVQSATTSSPTKSLLFNIPTDNETATSLPSVQTSQQIQKKTSPAVNIISLLRFAITQLYAPRRLLTETLGVTRVPMYTHKTVTLFTGETTNAFPLISWRGDNLTVTAVLVKNTQRQKIILDPRTIIGDWQALAFYPSNVLQPQGQPTDRTTVFVVSNQPFGEALTANGVAR